MIDYKNQLIHGFPQYKMHLVLSIQLHKNIFLYQLDTYEEIRNVGRNFPHLLMVLLLQKTIMQGKTFQITLSSSFFLTLNFFSKTMVFCFTLVFPKLQASTIISVKWLEFNVFVQYSSLVKLLIMSLEKRLYEELIKCPSLLIVSQIFCKYLLHNR